MRVQIQRYQTDIAGFIVVVVRTISQMEKYGAEVLKHSLPNLHKRLQNSLCKDQTGILDRK